MAELLNEAAVSRGDTAALIDEGGETTWSELNSRVNQLIHGLRARGLVDGSTIAVMSRNCREVFEVFLAAMHSNWVVVPVNWHWVAEELAYVLSNSDSVALIVDEEFEAVATEARTDPRVVNCRVWWTMGPEASGFESMPAVRDAMPASEPDGQGTGGPMFYTSGTTGFPKGVRSALSKTGLPMVMWSLISGSFTNMLGLPEAGVTLLDGPVYHSAQWVFAMFPLLNGSTVVMRHAFDPAATLAAIDRYSVTNAHFVPTQFIRLLRVDPSIRDAFSGSSLRVVFHGAAPCSEAVKRSMLDWFGPIVTEYYGGTEGGFLTAISGDEWLGRPGSLGRPLELMEIMVVDEEGNSVEPGVSGQIYFRSKVGSDFEYHGDEEKTAAAHLSDGWGTLGDIGFFDSEGYLFMSDRKIDMIISGGVNIYPAEIEGVLVAHPAVSDAAVFGIPDDEMGERVFAAVQLFDPADATDAMKAELEAHCRGLLAGYKVPRVMEFAQDLPRTPTGKLAKRLLREPYWEGQGRSI